MNELIVTLICQRHCAKGDVLTIENYEIFMKIMTIMKFYEVFHVFMESSG